MNTKSKTKFVPVIIQSRTAMVTAVNDYVRDRIAHASLTLKMEAEVAEIQKRYQTQLDDLGRSISAAEAGIQVWAQTHRTEEFVDKKSIDLQSAVIGFRDTPHRVEKSRSKDTFEEIALRLAGYVELNGEGKPVFTGEDYVSYPPPELSKKALLTDRLLLPDAMLKAVGIRFASDELFYIEPKSEVLTGVKAEAA